MTRQITHGMRAVLSHPFIYSALQSFMGGHKSRKDFVANCVKPFSGMKVLDVGCGPADILGYLPDVDYWGFDISPNYIDQAKKKFGAAGHFYCKALASEDLENLSRFDIVLAVGVLHHLDDKTACGLLCLAHQALRPGGRLITIDPCFEAGQNALARLIISWDRGQNVRTREGYTALVSKVFPEPHAEIRHRSWIPYTHCYMVCRK